MLNIYQQNHSGDEALGKNSTTPPKPPGHSDYRKYTDASGELQSKELQRGIWVVSHRVWIYRLIVLVFVLLNVFLWMTSLIRWGAFFIDWKQHTTTLAGLTRFPNYANVNRLLAAKNIEVLDTSLVPGGVGRYDAIAEVANPNDDFIAYLEYRFLVNGSSTEKATAMLLPGQSRPVAVLGLQGYEFGDAELRVDKTRWTRVNRHRFNDPIQYQKERLDFTTSNFVFTPPQVGDGVPAATIAFNLTNNSPYSYIEPKFLIGLYNGAETLVGVLPLTLDSLASLQTRTVDVRSFVRDLQVSAIEVFPLINVYDKEAYRAP